MLHGFHIDFPHDKLSVAVNDSRMKKGRHPTLSEVAKRAGVGTTTVSRVINGGQSVNPETLARVRRVIDKLGYIPNPAARTLKGARTRTIGFVIPSIADPFFSSCAEAAHSVAQANGSLLIVVATDDDPEAELNGVKVLLQHRVDGFIIAPASLKSELLRELLPLIGVPVVALDRPIPGSDVPSVVADNFTSACLAAQHLIEHGYKRIVCVTGDIKLFTIQERIRGYRKAMQTAGLEVRLDNSLKEHVAEPAIRSMLAGSHPPEALFTLKNSLTVSAFAALQQLGIAVPGRVALLGYDDFSLAAMVRPSITVVRQPVEEIGRIAAELLFERLLKGPEKKTGRPGHIEVKTRLILRNSCGCLPSFA